jgi:hypothetical protein
MLYVEPAGGAPELFARDFKYLFFAQQATADKQGLVFANWIAGLPEDQRPGTVVVGIMTDGLENASREWSYPQVKHLIERQSNDYQWQFLYLGADQDAVEVGMSIGVGAGHSVTYGRGKVKQAMAATAANVSSYRNARAAGMPAAAAAAMSEFTEQQRRDAAD